MIFARKMRKKLILVVFQFSIFKVDNASEENDCTIQKSQSVAFFLTQKSMNLVKKTNVRYNSENRLALFSAHGLTI